MGTSLPPGRASEAVSMTPYPRIRSAGAVLVCDHERARVHTELGHEVANAAARANDQHCLVAERLK